MLGSMRLLFEGLVAISYHTILIFSGDLIDDQRIDPFAGQSNGLCGAGIAGQLSFWAMPHTADVPVRVELHEQRPPIAQDWEEVVEVSFTPTAADVTLQGWESPWYPLALPVQSYRVRFYSSQMDVDEYAEPEPRWRGHLVQFWPAPTASDSVVRVTSRGAAILHRHARGLPAPPTAAELAEQDRQKAEQWRLQQAEFQRRDEERRWSGRAPSPRLRASFRVEVPQLAQLDRDLLDQLAAATPEAQRSIALWAAERAAALARIDDLPWVASALATAHLGTALPPPFHSREAAFDRLFQELLGTTGKITHAAVVVSLPEPAGAAPQSPANSIMQKPIAALHAILSTVEPDPLRAACFALASALNLAGPDQATMLARVRELL